MPTPRTRPYSREDEEALLLRLADEAARDSSLTPPSEWRHRFLENPVGHRVRVVRSASGGLLDPQTGVALRVLRDGEESTWCRRAAGFTKDGRAARDDLDAHASWLKEFVGLEEGQDSMAFAMLGEAGYAEAIALGYEQVRSIDKLSVSPSCLCTSAQKGIDIRELERFDAEVDSLTERVAGNTRAFAARTAEALNWRFCHAPGSGYRVAAARRASELVGFAVYTAAEFDGSRQALVVDWWVPWDDTEVASALIDWLGRCAQTDGQERLTAVFPETSLPWITFQHAGFRVRPTSYFLLARPIQKRFHVQWLYWNWYYTLADLGAF